MTRRWTIRKTSRKPGQTTLMGWKVEGFIGGRYIWKKDFPTFDRAHRYVSAAISRRAIIDFLSVLDKAPEGEYEAIPAYVIQGRDLAEKRLRVYATGRRRGLYLHTEVEIEDDPRDTLILARIGRRGDKR